MACSSPLSRFSVCGQIAITRLPEGLKQQGRYKVNLTPLGQDNTATRTANSDQQGAFCFYAKPGDYSVTVRYRNTACSDYEMNCLYFGGFGCIERSCP